MAGVPPKKNTAHDFYVSLEDQANAGLFKSNPTLAAGDVLVAVDDAAPANLTTLPVVDADFQKRVKVSLSAAEMNGDQITVIFSDAAGDEWFDLEVNITTSVRQIDDLAFPATSGRSLTVAATGEASANVTYWLGAVAPAAPPTKAELDAGFLAQAGADGDTLESLSDQIDGIGGAAGSGAISHTITVDDGTNPLDGAEVWVSTDLAGSNVVAGTSSTDALGQVTFLLDAGTYYQHVQLAGYNFTVTAFTVA